MRLFGGFLAQIVGAPAHPPKPEPRANLVVSGSCDRLWRASVIVVELQGISRRKQGIHPMTNLAKLLAATAAISGLAAPAAAQYQYPQQQYQYQQTYPQYQQQTYPGYNQGYGQNYGNNSIGSIINQLLG